MKLVLFFALLAASVAILLGAKVQLNEKADTGEAAKRELLRNNLSKLLRSALDREGKRENKDVKVEDGQATDKKTNGPAKKHAKLRALISNMKQRKLMARNKQSRGSDKQHAERLSKQRSRDHHAPTKNEKRGNVVARQISNKRGKTERGEMFKKMKTFFSSRAEAAGNKEKNKRGPAEKRQYGDSMYGDSCGLTCEDCFSIFTAEGTCDIGNYDYYDYTGNYHDSHYDDMGYDGYDYMGYDGYDYMGYGGYYDPDGNLVPYDYGYTDDYFGDTYYQCSMKFEYGECSVMDYGAPTYDCSCEIPCYYKFDDNFDWCVLDQMSAMKANYTMAYGGYNYDELDCLMSNLFTEIYVRMDMWLHYGLDYNLK